MFLNRKKYLYKIKSIKKIQKWFKQILINKMNRNYQLNFQKIKFKFNINIISNWYLKLERKKKLKKYIKAVEIIERYRYGLKIKRLYNKVLLQQSIKLYVLLIKQIQNWYRHCINKKIMIKRLYYYSILIKNIIILQSHIRGYLIRKDNILDKLRKEKEISNIKIDPLIGIERLSIYINVFCFILSLEE